VKWIIDTVNKFTKK
ncbi:delta-lysin family phenol-soluble modulin, partial [Staphylococcus aureus]|nr:delta-lysin family phenol-soluble modulin [Staphylococcus aureus]HCW9004402.1 delta-lysin family phenol-soluble modulin [Staphylococcus aureus]HCY0018168.1 delta-lysin family phenol-soluble modulin [Staphylococcus aureus]